MLNVTIIIIVCSTKRIVLFEQAFVGKCHFFYLAFDLVKIHFVKSACGVVVE
jgi:hypothetical protein